MREWDLKEDSVFSKFSPKNIYYFGMCPFYSFPLVKSQNYRQFVEELLTFKNIATRELILDCIMRKLGVSFYFLSKKKKCKTENKPNGFGKNNFLNKQGKPSSLESCMDLTATVHLRMSIYTRQYLYSTDIIMQQRDNLCM